MTIHNRELENGCPCPTCSSQNVKKAGDDDFEISDDLDSGKKNHGEN